VQHSRPFTQGDRATQHCRGRHVRGFRDNRPFSPMGKDHGRERTEWEALQGLRLRAADAPGVMDT